MFTLGYAFRPWKDSKAIADGAAIRHYIQDTAREHGVEEQDPLPPPGAVGRLVERGRPLDGDRPPHRHRRDGAAHLLVAVDVLGLLPLRRGLPAEFEGEEDFAGEVIHPQHWPEDFDATGKRIVVIGSGATAVTLVPSLAPDAEHVTMLQRTPSYVLSLPGRDPLAQWLRNKLPATVAYPIVRWKNVLLSTALLPVQPAPPAAARRLIRRLTASSCRTSTSTRTSTRRTTRGTSGCAWCPTATCSAPCAAASLDRDGPDRPVHREGHRARVGRAPRRRRDRHRDRAEPAADGRDGAEHRRAPVDVSEAVSYKGMMISGVPNFTMVIGYTNASWTLKADLVNRYVCRLLNHLDAEGYASATPVAPPGGRRPAVPRPGLGLRPAEPGRPAQAGTAHALAAAPELHPRRPADAAGPAGRRGHDLPAARPATTTEKAVA